MAIEITNQTRIQENSDYWYTVEDTHLDVGFGGCTISYWELKSSPQRVNYICMEAEEALAVVDAIYKFFKSKSNPHTINIHEQT
jgi:hypothetical protein